MIARHRGEYPLTLMCRVLDVAPSGFYAWETSGPSVRAQTDAALPVAPNRLARQFAVAQPNRVWAADLTYCWTQEGWLYLAVILDLCSRRVVGWATSPTPDAEVALAAWRRAYALSVGPQAGAGQACAATSGCRA